VITVGLAAADSRRQGLTAAFVDRVYEEQIDGRSVAAKPEKGLQLRLRVDRQQRGLVERYDRIEVSSRDWRKGHDQGSECCAGGKRVCQKRNSNIAPGQALTHNSGTDNCRQ